MALDIYTKTRAQLNDNDRKQHMVVFLLWDELSAGFERPILAGVSLA